MDKAGARLGYTLGISLNKRPYEAPLKTNQGDFQALIPVEGGSGYFAIGDRLPRERRSRLAGDAFNLDLVSSSGTPRPLPEPFIGRAELRIPDLPQ